MNKHLLGTLLAISIIGAWYISSTPAFESEEGEENEQEAGYKRGHFEWMMSHDPATGVIPQDIRRKELDWVKSVGARRSGMLGYTVSNNYAAVGPTQNGGRTRALAFDIRNNGGSNRVVLAGGINGGIFRSEDGGSTWKFVHPSDEIRSVSCIAQDTRVGYQDTWYAGTGEALGASASIAGASVLGYGMFKSTDNGKTWSKLAATVSGNSQITFDNTFDIISNIAVHPVNGDLYVAGHRRIQRSSDGGATFNVVLEGLTAATTYGGVSDILISKNGSKIFASITGRSPEREFAGVWMSSTGNVGSWTRIAGGVKNSTDSVPGWRAYDQTIVGNDYAGGWGRIVMALSANQNQLYTLVENSVAGSSTAAEADLFRADISASPITWTNLSANLYAKYNGTETVYLPTQGGYDLEIACHPTQNNTVFIGGVYVFRSTDGFTTGNNNTFMGGLYKGKASSTFSDPDGITHADNHRFKFDPSNPNRMIVGSDGGLAITDDATATIPAWQNGNYQYQTFQYYYVGMDPQVGSRTYFGGAQDNSTSFRDMGGIFGGLLPDSNDHYIIVGGDGGQASLFRNANQPYMLASAQEGRLYRLQLFGTVGITSIKPARMGSDMFVTYFHQDEDNPSNVYFPSNDTIYRTTTITTASPTTGWNRLSGVDIAASGQIYAMATSRGTYKTSSMLLFGTSVGKLYRLKNPAGTDTAAAVEDITPSTLNPNTFIKDISFNPRNHDTCMVVVSNYNVPSIFWTGNASATTPTWQMVEGNLTLPAVRSCRIVATKAGMEYYVGTTVGLFSTNTINGSSTVWSRENGGNGMMNTAVVNSLAYRWQDNTLLVGTHGNGMFVANIGNAISIATPVNDPIRDDKNFVVRAYPTIATSVVNYQAGNMLGIKNVQVQVYNLGGQVMVNKTVAYGSGNVDVSRLPAGTYILTITSSDRKYQFIQRFVR
jgi:hypothetical protein